MGRQGIIMKIAILGAGALGIMFSGYLAKDNDVTLIDINRDVINSINSDGVRVIDGEETITADVKAILSGTCEETFDLVICLVKNLYTLDTLNQNRGIIGKETYVLTLQNGLGNKEKIINYVDENHLFIGVTRVNAVKTGLNESKRSNHGVTIISFNDENTGFANALKDTFIKASFDAELNQNIDELVFRKVLVNIIFNPYCALYKDSIGKLINTPCHWTRSKAALKEAIEVAKKMNIALDYEKELKGMEESFGNVEGYPSMYQDVENKRKTEIDSLNGAIVTLGEKYEVDVSENRKITREIKEIEERY